jgi:membrane-bound lytic murein transglycosylase D
MSQKQADSNIGIRYADNKLIVGMNKNRPAFLPVAFAGDIKDASEVGVITVDFDETLSHYAEWGKLPIKTILSINGMRNRSKLNIHSKVKVPFTNTDSDSFEERRQEYHKAIQEDFFNNYRIDKLLIRDISKGETVWEICNDIYSIPFWLLASYNPEKEINTLSTDESIIVPIISPVNFN